MSACERSALSNDAANRSQNDTFARRMLALVNTDDFKYAPRNCASSRLARANRPFSRCAETNVARVRIAVSKMQPGARVSLKFAPVKFAHALARHFVRSVSDRS